MAFIDNLFPWFAQMIDLGGNILLLIVVLAAFLWSLLLERFLFIGRVYPQMVNQAVSSWNKRGDRRTWYAQQFRNYLLYKANSLLQRNFGLLKTLIKLCPLLGLLGTVLGMLEIFDAVAITGGNNPRVTAGGVSKAIITTMAGMVIAISGLPIMGYLARRVEIEKEKLAEHLPLDG